MAFTPTSPGNMPNSSKKRKAADLERGQSPPTAKSAKRRSKSKRRSVAPVDDIPFTTESPLKDGHIEGDAFIGTETLSEGFTFRYAVRPGTKWKEMRSYKNVKYAENTFSIGDVVYINKKQIPPKAPPDSASDEEVLAYDRKNFWVARIADTRAISANAVYLRIYWLYWPEELPMGRQAYHTDNELVLSNAMEIVDAQTISSLADVAHWDDNDVEAHIPDRFWRQTLDIGQLGSNQKGGLSLLKAHCICQQPYNPEEMMYQCKDPQCATWNHGECLVKDADERAHKLYNTNKLDQAVADASTMKVEAKDSLRFLSPFRDLGKFVQNKVLPAMGSTPDTTVKEEEEEEEEVNGSGLEGEAQTRSIQRQALANPVLGDRTSNAGRFRITIVGADDDGPLLAKIEQLAGAVGKKKKVETTGKVWFIHVNCLQCGKTMD